MKQFKTNNGLPFYTEWAFVTEYDDIVNANAKALDEYSDRYIMVKSGQRTEDVIRENPDKMVYSLVSHMSKGDVYYVHANPENLHKSVIALIVDGGNLCFGFTPTVFGVDIFTD